MRCYSNDTAVNVQVTVELFKAALDDPSEYVQRSAIQALGRLYKQSVVVVDASSKRIALDEILDSIRHMLHSPKDRVRMTAARTLQAMHCGNKVKYNLRLMSSLLSLATGLLERDLGFTGSAAEMSIGPQLCSQSHCKGHQVFRCSS